MIIHNAFSPHYVSEIVLKAETHEIRLHNAKSKEAREKLVFAETKNHINITSQAASDRSKRVAGRHLRG